MINSVTARCVNSGKRIFSQDDKRFDQPDRTVWLCYRSEFICVKQYTYIGKAETEQQALAWLRGDLADDGLTGG